MEEEKAAAYYDELSRKGEGAARFKQGLGFSSAAPESDSFPAKPKTSSSLFSTFIRASSPSAKSPKDQHRKQARLGLKSPEDQHRKKARLEIIQNKLRKERRRSPSHSPDRDRRRRSPSHSPDQDRRRPRRSPFRSPDRENRLRRSRDRDDRRSGDRRRRSHSRERRRESDRRRRSRDRDEDSSYSRSRKRSRSRSPYRDSRSGDRERRGGHEKEKGGEKHRSSRNKSASDGVDYSQMIEGYSKMTPAERVKEKMKLQLSESVAKDTDKGMGSGWERFDFNKDAPLDDDDDEIEVADDDASLVKDIGKSFRFSAVEAKREEEIKAAHDNAMFGASTAAPVLDMEPANNNNVADDATEKIVNEPLISDKVIAMQQSSWRDRARRFRDDSES
ncbi:serine/Arginine-related protein 53 isoform X1 [Canna indica]|uniref:Serine/Arginine-related protein 53 isoform X1 n=1 Tax=Canna indica TaxID=4628 RepID=A0AAQ3L1W3_9LILI|nr:serine/Arginine-related protein 53 isoform X1 [Canna indica]